MNILLAVDGSPYSKKMLAYLSTHAALLGTQHTYTVFHAQAALPARARAALGKSTVDQYYADEADKVLTPVAKFLQRHRIRATLDWKVGAAGALIGQRADTGTFDLVVMGSHGHTALGNLVMGSVATQVLAHCKTPVLLVR
ncbi:MAG: universal stress protein [Rhodoferax sp.]|nr:universal stress protein [Rhodoferax sp.]